MINFFKHNKIHPHSISLEACSCESNSSPSSAQASEKRATAHNEVRLMVVYDSCQPAVSCIRSCSGSSILIIAKRALTPGTRDEVHMQNYIQSYPEMQTRRRSLLTFAQAERKPDVPEKHTQMELCSRVWLDQIQSLVPGRRHRRRQSYAVGRSVC